MVDSASELSPRSMMTCSRGMYEFTGAARRSVTQDPAGMLAAALARYGSVATQPCKGIQSRNIRI